MFATLEARWFFEGDLPGEVEEAFGEDAVRNEKAIDRYLVLYKTSNLGMKLRGSSLEIKWREGARAHSVLGEHVRGCLGTWRKIALPLKDADVRNVDGLLVPVIKFRRTRVFGVIDDGCITTAPEPEFPRKGCRIELSNLCVADNGKFWTVCLDAFGGSHREMLKYIRLAALRESPFLAIARVSEEHAFDYPEWLFRIKASASSP